LIAIGNVLPFAAAKKSQKKARPIHTRFTTRTSCATRRREQASFANYIGCHGKNLTSKNISARALSVQIQFGRPAVLRHDQIDRAVVIEISGGARTLFAVNQQSALLPRNRAKTAAPISLQ
jgi:hypothetical protein